MFDLLQVMQQDGYLSSVELLALRKTCKELGENPVRVMRSLNIASPEQIQDYLQRYFRIHALSDKALSLLDESHQSLVPIDLAIHYSCFGIGEENYSLYVALEDPSDRGIVQQLQFFLGKRIVAVSATVYQLADALTKIYNVSRSHLNLTTVLEKTRGVLGGVRYEAPHIVDAITIGEDFKGVQLSNDLSNEVDTFVESTPEAPKPTAEAGGGDVEPSAEISLDSLPEQTPEIVAVEEDVSVEEIAQGESIEASENSKTALTNGSLAQISSLVSSALVKMSMLSTQNEAINMLNGLLKEFNTKVSLPEKNSYQVQGEGFSVTGNLESKMSDELHPIAYALDPVLKKVLKMKE